jgi:integrase
VPVTRPRPIPVSISLRGILPWAVFAAVLELLVIYFVDAEQGDVPNRRALRGRDPQGGTGRPSKSLTLPQAEALVDAAVPSAMHAYVVLSLLIGARAEELRALIWSHVDLDGTPASAGLDPRAWTPMELRRSFVSLMSDAGVPVEQIARLVGHSGTTTTEAVYRKQIRPVLIDGADGHGPYLPGPPTRSVKSRYLGTDEFRYLGDIPSG